MSKLRLNELETLDGTGTVQVSDLAILSSPEGTYKIATIGDSLTTNNALQETSWPTLLEEYVNKSGGDEQVSVVNYARNSFTFKQANEDSTAFGNETAVDAIIGEAPDLVICALGLVDVDANELGRSLSDLQNDASTFYSTLKAALPNTKFVQVKNLSWDQTNGDINNLDNKDVLPFFMEKRSSGILANTFTPEILNDPVSATTQSNLLNSESFYTHISNLTEVDAMFDLDYWKIARLGLLGPDGLHPRTLGRIFQTGYVIKGLVNNSVDGVFTSLGDKEVAEWYDPDLAINDIIDPLSNWDYSYEVNRGYQAASQQHVAQEIAPNTWFYPSKGSIHLHETTFNTDQPFYLSVSNCPPNAEVYPSVDGGAFDAGNPTLTLDSAGHGIVALINPLESTGTYTFRYQVANQVYGPFNITFNERGDLSIADGGTNASTAAAARTNLDVYSKSEVDAIAGGGDLSNYYTKSESDDTYLNESSNLSDLPNKTTARTNLGVDLDGPFNLSLQNGWVQSNVTYEDPIYMKDHNGRVYLQGSMTSGTDTICATLPAGYRPTTSVGFVHAIEGQPQVMLVYPDGRIDIADYTLGSNDLAFLDGISFQTNT